MLYLTRRESLFWLFCVYFLWCILVSTLYKYGLNTYFSSAETALLYSRATNCLPSPVLPCLLVMRPDYPITTINKMFVSVNPHSWPYLLEEISHFHRKELVRKETSIFLDFLVKVLVLRDIKSSLYSPSVTLVKSPALSIVSSSENLFLICLKGVSSKQWTVQYVLEGNLPQLYLPFYINNLNSMEQIRLRSVT